MATTVKITETYDMKTTVNKVGIVGIHTPQLTVIRRLYPGLLKNHRFIRFLKCDVVGACASVLPADPLQVGVEAGDVAPEDMFNPILYKAVTNESWDTLVGRIRALSGVGSLGSVDAGDLNSFGADSNFNQYYGLLAENGVWRKSMPQSGFSIRNLVPLAHTLLSSFGNVGANKGNVQALAPGEGDDTVEISVPDMNIPTETASFAYDDDGDKAVYFRGKTVRMPKFPLHTQPETLDDIPYPNIPKTTVLAMVIPPARLHEFWYRMRVSWYVRFENVISTNEIGNFDVMRYTGSNSYGSNYSYVSSKSEMDNETDMTVSDGVEIHKIMES